MTEAKRHVAARQFGKMLLSLFFLPCPLAVAGQSDQKQDKAEDGFVAQHREATRKNPERVSFALRLEEDKVQFKSFQS